MPETPSTPFVLRLTASPDAPASARLFLTTSLRVTGHADEVIEDARLAVSELVTAAVVAHPDSVIEVVFGGAGQQVVAVSPLAATDLEQDAALVVDGLFDRAQHEGGIGFVIPSTGIV